MSNELITFNFTNNTIRTALVSNEPYFCLRDCAKALGIKDCTDRTFEKGAENISTLTKGGMQKITFINEPNLYRLVFRSRKPQAQAFADWVYSEVLPTIRKTGCYSTAPGVDMKALGGMVKRCCRASIKEYWVELLSGHSETTKSIQETLNYMMKQCLSEELRKHDAFQIEMMSAKVTSYMMYLKRDELAMKADEYRRKADSYASALREMDAGIKKIEEAFSGNF